MEKNIKSISENDNLKEVTKDVLQYQFLTLQYGIALNDFDIKWFQNLLDKLKGGDD